MTTSCQCWQGVQKLLRGQGTNVSPNLLTLSEAKSKSSSAGATAHARFTAQAPAPIQVPVTSDDVAGTGDMPANLLQLDPGIAAIHQGVDTFHCDEVPLMTPNGQMVQREPPGLAGMGLLVPPSPGSALHGAGNCNPCAWHWKPKGCVNDRQCPFCHLCPDGELKNRKKAKLSARRATGTMTPNASMNAAPKSPAAASKGGSPMLARRRRLVCWSCRTSSDGSCSHTIRHLGCLHKGVGAGTATAHVRVTESVCFGGRWRQMALQRPACERHGER